MRFADRRDAGRQLAAALERLHLRAPIVLAAPRGGVIVAREVAARLGAPLDVIVARKLRAPDTPELAIGAVAETGVVYLEERTAGAASPVYLDGEIAMQQREVERRVGLYRGGRRLPELAGRTVVVVDDGLATGATMMAALRAARQCGAAVLVAAVPVAPPEGVARLAEYADDVVCLFAPAVFHAVGQFYDDFAQVEDDEVLAVLAGRRPSGGAPAR